MTVTLVTGPPESDLAEYAPKRLHSMTVPADHAGHVSGLENVGVFARVGLEPSTCHWQTCSSGVRRHPCRFRRSQLTATGSGRLPLVGWWLAAVRPCRGVPSAYGPGGCLSFASREHGRHSSRAASALAASASDFLAHCGESLAMSVKDDLSLAMWRSGRARASSPRMLTASSPAPRASSRRPSSDRQEIGGIALPGGKIVPVLPVLVDSYKGNPSSVQAAVSDATNNASTIDLLGATLPIVLAAVGFALAVLAVIFWMRGRARGGGIASAASPGDWQSPSRPRRLRCAVTRLQLLRATIPPI